MASTPIGSDLLIEQRECSRTDRGSPEAFHAAENGHDQRLRRFGPISEVRKHPAIENTKQSARDSGKEAGDYERRKPIGPDVDADEAGAFRVVADHGQNATKG